MGCVCTCMAGATPYISYQSPLRRYTPHKLSIPPSSEAWSSKCKESHCKVKRGRRTAGAKGGGGCQWLFVFEMAVCSRQTRRWHFAQTSMFSINSACRQTGLTEPPPVRCHTSCLLPSIPGHMMRGNHSGACNSQATVLLFDSYVRLWIHAHMHVH